MSQQEYKDPPGQPQEPQEPQDSNELSDLSQEAKLEYLNSIYQSDIDEYYFNKEREAELNLND